MDRSMRNWDLPVLGESENATLRIPREMTNDEWERLMGMLFCLRPAVTVPGSHPFPEDLPGGER